MTLDEFRREMEGYRNAVSDEAAEYKDTYIALARLRALYGRFDSEERAMADQVVGEWALADDEGLRFDALALIDEFRISSAMPALETLAARLSRSATPGAPYELERVTRIVGSLGGRA